MYNSRSHRAETRNRTKDELKRVINSVERVRKWEKKWVLLKDSSIRVFKWVPISQQLIAPPPPKVSVVDGDASNTNLSGDNSQDNTDSSNAPTRLRFAVGEDSNTGFSDAGFDSDSNQMGEAIYRQNAGLTSSTDFSQMRNDEINKK